MIMIRHNYKKQASIVSDVMQAKIKRDPDTIILSKALMLIVTACRRQLHSRRRALRNN